MIKDLRIKNIGVIEDISLDLSDGFTVLTGETGAGKTMVLSSFEMICGEKVDNSIIRVNEETALVEAFIEVTNDELKRNIKELEIDLEDKGVLISRSISNSSRGKTFLGSRSISGNVLKDLTQELVTIHGQGDQTSLNKSTYQRALLDTYIGSEHLENLKKYEESYRILKEFENELNELIQTQNKSNKDTEEIEKALSELKSANIQLDEEKTITEKLNLINSSENIFETLKQADQLLSGGEDSTQSSITSLVSNLRKILDSASSKSKRIETLRDIVVKNEIELKDLAQEIGKDLISLDRDPEVIDQLEARRSLLNKLLIKYGPTSKDAIEKINKFQEILDGNNNLPELIKEKTEQISKIRLNLSETASKLSKNRTKFSKIISKEIENELVQLSMPGAKFSVTVFQNEVSDGLEIESKNYSFDSFGVDQVRFEFSANPGQPLQPINKIASGGEMSRIMLAIELIFSKKAQKRTMIFDEVDAGIGGEAAIEVGKRLKLLAQKHQVVVVTHLPQVAAFADTHLKVAKTTEADVTKTNVVLLDKEQRLTEIARMMAGLSDSSSAIEHARELIDLSRSVSL
ncbi:MAG: DNA repair protein RecN [Actinobacteria bacterium]|nr:DNA repair protein RecN [Actinomycetota bacterium]